MSCSAWRCGTAAVAWAPPARPGQIGGSNAPRGTAGKPRRRRSSAGIGVHGARVTDTTCSRVSGHSRLRMAVSASKQPRRPEAPAPECGASRATSGWQRSASCILDPGARRAPGVKRRSPTCNNSRRVSAGAACRRATPTRRSGCAGRAPLAMNSCFARSTSVGVRGAAPATGSPGRSATPSSALASGAARSPVRSGASATPRCYGAAPLATPGSRRHGRSPPDTGARAAPTPGYRSRRCSASRKKTSAAACPRST